MTQSALVSRTIPHHNKLGSRDGRSVDRVIQHHWAGPGGDARLANPTQQASSNYLIYSDGTIAIQVPEEYRAWTSGSYEADVNSITIEVENNSYQKHGNDNHPDSWSISDAAYNAIVALLADITRRYGWGSVTNDRYRGHREFSSTACPGGYLWARMADIRQHANAALGSTFTPLGSISQEEDDEMASPEVMTLLADIAARVSATNNNVVAGTKAVLGDVATVHNTIIKDVGGQLGNIQKGVKEKVDVNSLALELVGKLEQRDLDALVAKLTITVKES